MALARKGTGRALDEGITLLSSVVQIDPFNDAARSCLDSACKLRGQKINC
jgi:hypothetical protein